MSKRNIITCIVLIAILSAGIAAAVYYLYADVPGYPWSEKNVARLEASSKTEVATEDTVKVEVVAAETPKEEPQHAQEQNVQEQKVQEVKAEAKPAKVEVQVPAGPFAVKNIATGKTAYIGQSSDNSLYMEEDGKTLWSKAFSSRICGAVKEMDYFENGKLQYVFISGSSLYLIDRNGNNVKGFPKTLKKEVLIGPAVYDFNKIKKYNIVVLNKDNTIDMYNLKGERPKSWVGISSDETILELPELIKISGKSYWKVKTQTKTQHYPFYGGKPVEVK